MPYGLIVFVACIALAGVYVFASNAPIWFKVLVATLLFLSFGWRYGLYLRVGIAVFLSLYFTYLKSRWDRD
jgi:hypothetical protein